MKLPSYELKVLGVALVDPRVLCIFIAGPVVTGAGVKLGRWWLRGRYRIDVRRLRFQRVPLRRWRPLHVIVCISAF